MSRSVVFAFNFTADGYCSHMDMVADDAVHDFFTELLRGADILLYGRTTYELMVPYWPDVARAGTDVPSNLEFARAFDSLEKVVFSRTLKKLDDRHSRLARSGPAEELRALKQKPGKNIAVGSLSIASQLSDQGLIDEYHFVIHPVVAGKGPRMFERLKLKDTVRLELMGSRTFGSGAVALQYRKL